MPPTKRKSAATKSSAKKIKQEAATDDIEVRWEWEDGVDAWIIYGDEQQDKIKKACQGGKANVELSVDGGNVKIVLNKMVQKNKQTGWERRIRCACKETAQSDCIVWEWEDETGSWNCYPAAASLDIHKAQAGGEGTVKIVSAGKTYNVDLATMQQTNSVTGISRKIRQTKSSAKPPTVVIKKEKPMNGSKAAVKASSNGNKSSAVKGKSAAASKSRGRDLTKEKSVSIRTKKGVAPTDSECPKCGSASVYVEGKDVYDVMLNQTNIGNNNNKYFIIQLLQDDGRQSYSVWFRWGRVGYNGQSNLVTCGPNLDQAKTTFCKKFSDKTKNDWCDRNNFEKVAGKYDLVEIDYGKDVSNDTDSVDGSLEESEEVKSKIDPKLQDLIKLICDVKAMTELVIEMKFDANKNPLGKLTKQQIKAGYAALKTIDQCIRKKDFGSRLNHACSEFYTRIPHDFGFKTPPTIRTQEEVKAKMALLEALDDIEIAMKIINERVSSENPIDTHYKSLNCSLTPLSYDSADFKMIVDFVKSSHAPTHNHYTLTVMDVFNAERKHEMEAFNDVGNRRLLWHGSRLTNWIGILSQGLRIAPPEAPVTGYMFGKGVYFADVCSKSANYCFANRSKPEALLLLCEVSLGQCNELLAADYQANKLPAGKHSVWGKGKLAPEHSKDFKMADGCTISLGKVKDTGIHNPHGYTLNYNEFIAYNTNQIKLRYLVKVKFNFK